MSIFPKRTIPGNPVTIHWNISTVPPQERHLFPYVRIGVRDPLKRVTTLFEDHILILPEDEKIESSPGKQKRGYLQKDLPILVLADYLSGPGPREELVKILERIRTGKHFYFTFPVSQGAPLGRYEIISEMYIEGFLHHSATAEDDHFFVEALELLSLSKKRKGYQAAVKNPSPEPIPARLVECDYKGIKLKTNSRVIDFPPKKITEITFQSDKTFIFFNEEREIISLWESPEPSIARNQRLFSLPGDGKTGDVTFILPREGDEALTLTGSARTVWEKASCLVTKDELLRSFDENMVKEMIDEGLISEHWLSGTTRGRRSKK